MQRTIADIAKTIHKTYKGSTLLPKSQESTRLVLLEACRIIGDMLRAGDNVYLSELGTFELRWSQGKHIVHPKTGVDYTIPPHYKGHFAFATKLKRDIANMKYIEPAMSEQDNIDENEDEKFGTEVT